MFAQITLKTPFNNFNKFKGQCSTGCQRPGKRAWR